MHKPLHSWVPNAFAVAFGPAKPSLDLTIIDDSASVSAVVPALENVYTDADLFETICHIRKETNWMELSLMN